MEDENDTVAVVAGRYFCAPYPIELTLQKGGKDFIITDSNGNIVLIVAAFHGKRLLQDDKGNVLLTMRKKKLSMHKRWEAYKGRTSAHKKLLFTAKKSSMFQLKTVLDVFLLSNFDQKHSDFRVKGSYLQRDCTIYRGKRVVAEMKRKYTTTNAVMEKDTFVVVVEPGIDCAFIVCLVVILDRITRKSQG
ncbi:hypothetical protein SUGI_0785490 [Cryptomeria japonica]|uniref:protein LURP-one-related 15 n=1 Tax=Cryptomeria japonica TaxID=3369 RepID=UPI002414BA80|nr:protein LURP-one-related 15 [Cryptomeria japonica]GLJ38541.1 hypothetical protein SUGI_0785490 [Cryptomeria japonica]